jgi:hypothetical protein
VKCPACQTENAPGVAFCSHCSTPLPAEPAAGQYPSGQYPSPPGAQPSGDQYPPAGQYPQQPQGQYPSGQYPPPPAPGQPSGDQYPAGGQYPPPPAPGQYPSGDQYPPPGAPAGQPGQYPSGDQFAAPGAYGQGAPPPGYGGGPTYPGAPGYGPPPGAAKPKSSGRVLLVVVSILAIAAVAAAAFIFTKDDGGDSDEVVLEPIGSVQEDDFAGNLDAQNLAEGINMALGGAPEMNEQSSTVLANRVADGGTPGLYGGSRDTQVCDVQRLTEFLTDSANSDKAQAWAGALGISTDEIPDYIASLTAVRLRFDTRVTNHGFSGGEANAFQSLLQAGTAVLVDDQGVPRVKCNCGNPLAEPEQQAEGDSGGSQSIADIAQNPEDDWDIDPANVMSIQPASEPVQNFVVVNPDDGAMFQRPAGSNGDADADPTDIGDACQQLEESPSCGGSGTEALNLGGGNVQITLQWSSNADLDLHVTEPNGTEISYLDRGPTSTGGQLDKDSNVGCTLNGAIENVFWPGDQPAPAGAYSIAVTGYNVGTDTCGGGDYTLTIRVEGQPTRTETGSVADDESDPYTFNVG